MGPQTTVAQFQTRRAPDETGPDADAAQGTANAAVEAPSARKGVAWHWIATGGGVGALAGAVAAIGAVLAYTYLNPALDQRVEPIAGKLTTVDTDMRQLSATVGTMQAEMARVLDLETTIRERLDGQDEKIAALDQRAAEAMNLEATDTGVGSPLFGIAVLQLRAAFLAGRPFEPELVNLYNLVGADPEVSPRLQTLAGPARTGVVTLTDLRQQLMSTADAAGIQLPPSQGYYGYGMSLVSKYIGYAGEPYEVEAARHAVRQADGLLAQGEVAGAIERILDISGPQAQQLEPWLEMARHRLAAETAVAGLTDLVVASLKDKMAAGVVE
jgi:hypothetical protein